MTDVVWHGSWAVRKRKEFARCLQQALPMSYRRAYLLGHLPAAPGALGEEGGPLAAARCVTSGYDLLPELYADAVALSGATRRVAHPADEPGPSRLRGEETALRDRRDPRRRIPHSAALVEAFSAQPAGAAGAGSSGGLRQSEQLHGRGVRGDGGVGVSGGDAEGDGPWARAELPERLCTRVLAQ